MMYPCAQTKARILLPSFISGLAVAFFVAAIVMTSWLALRRNLEMAIVSAVLILSFFVIYCISEVLLVFM